MTQPKRRILLSLIVAIGAVIVAFWLVARFSVPEPLTLRDGSVVDDLTVAEVGPLARPQMRESRREYLSNLREYSKLEVTPLSDRDVQAVSEGLTGVLEQKLRENPADADALKTLPNGAAKSLSELIVAALRRASGGSLEEYRRALGPHRIVLPHFLDQSYAQDVYGHDLPIPADADDREAMDRLISLLHEETSGEQRLKGVALDSGAISAGIAPRSSAPGAAQWILVGRFSREEDEYFRGPVVQGQLVFHELRSEPDTGTQGHSMRAEVMLIVEDSGGDRYPMAFYLDWDQGSKRWWLRHVSRNASLRMAMTPPFVF